MAIGFVTSATYGTRTVRPDRGLSRQSSPRVLKVSFGDGYEQRLVDGINNLVQQYSITFTNRPKEEADDIMGYLESLNSVTAFDFTIPDSNGGGETTIKVVCESPSMSYMWGEAYTVSATLRRVYEP
jgi:phage-related protein